MHSKNIFPSTFLPCFSSDDMDGPVEDIGSRSCVTRFVKTLLSIMEHGVKPHSKHLTEYFAFLYEFAKMGEEEVGLSFYTQFNLLFCLKDVSPLDQKLYQFYWRETQKLFLPTFIFFVLF